MSLEIGILRFGKKYEIKCEYKFSNPLYMCFRKSSLRMADVSPRSSPLRDVLQGGTSTTQRQKFHTDDVNQCLHNKSGSHGVSNANLFNFTFLLVDFGKVIICE